MGNLSVLTMVVGAHLLTSWCYAQAPNDGQRKCVIYDLKMQDRWDGDCTTGFLNGRGKAVGTRSYEGEFFAGKKHGRGVYFFESGTRYEGEFKDDQMEGQGKLISKGGAVLEGDFRGGRLFGVGKMTKSSGETTRVILKDGKYVPYEDSASPGIANSARADKTTEKSTESTASAQQSPITSKAEWAPKVDFDNEIYPAYILATATKPFAKVSEFYLGDPYGSIGVVFNNERAGSRVRVKIELDTIAKPSEEEFVLDRVGEYKLYPKIQYHYGRLPAMKQPTTINARILVSSDTTPESGKTLTLRVRSVNDAPYARLIENGKVAFTPWVFAAFVNENHPWIHGLLQEALKTGRTRQFKGYQGSEQEVLREIDAIWLALKARGISYSSINRSSGESNKVKSQHVRLLSESVRYTQANCIDGTVLLASIFRKLGLEAKIVLVPGHAFVGVVVDKKSKRIAYIETTMLNSASLHDAIARGNQNYEKMYIPNKDRRMATTIIDVDIERRKGTLPING